MALQDPGPDAAAQTRNIIADMTHLEGPLLPMLHAVQAAFGHVPQEALPVIADTLNISNAEIHGVVSFYHDFRRAPAGRHVLKLCRAEACQSMGSEAVAAKLTALLGVRSGETSPDQAVTIEPVYCLGLCSCAPAALLDGEPIGRLDDERIVAIVERVRP
ncbi:formate dehydrogenase subunit gamma [Pelagibacterium lacus]|uniref:Formate dehydrogenase subunit gamma n=1 Tax=Pelagibacterium lacus TaxID=2282655 RepID=A0A369W8G8_9HYPH|nr:formate dehydrogenase subunit gamma [Pelagibacterium lacus]RDE08351.1 formate dehydrogenase subunit gamma [Pelagibacterium lacus]